MWYSVSHEALVFAVMAMGGVVLGVLFDMLRAVREEFRAGKAVTHVTDAVFWLAAGVITVYLLIRFNDGILRMYEFLGMLLGGFLYFCTLSVFIRKFFVFVLKILDKFIVLICKILLTPFTFLYKILLGLFISLRTMIVNKRKLRNEKKKEEKNHFG